jgi:hypothetical protein
VKYYKVKPEFDNKQAYKIIKNKLKIVGFYIANELYTANELKRRGDIINPNYFEIVEIPKTKIYWFFGARFIQEVIR